LEPPKPNDQEDRSPSAALRETTTALAGASTDPALTTAIEAAVFRRLLRHLDANRDVQNIDLMIVADFCRNCLAKWYVAAAREQGLVVEYEAARERIYGMPYSDWKEKFQGEATPEQQRRFAERRSRSDSASQ